MTELFGHPNKILHFDFFLIVNAYKELSTIFMPTNHENENRECAICLEKIQPGTIVRPLTKVSIL